MKTCNTYIKYFIIALIILLSNKISAAESMKNIDLVSDSIRISLLTCSPHDEIYSLYGHTAIRYEDKTKGIDIAINYGVFSFKQPYFILRFVFGITDYQIGIENFSDFCNEYKSYGSSVTQQTLNLNSEEKALFIKALAENYSEENRTYRYNYFYNNCTTKARDLLISSIQGKLIYKNRIDPNLSFRKIIHSCNNAHRWARFGNDILLGINADKSTSRQDQQFLPYNLQKDFDYAYIIDTNGKVRPLINERKSILSSCQNKSEKGFFTPTIVFTIFFCFIILLCAIELFTKKRLNIIDTILQLILGCIGILLFIMIFSEHPSTSINLQIILFNPIFIYIAFDNIRYRNEINKLKRNSLVSVIIIILAILGGLIQTYAEGITILALSLLLRYLVIYIQFRKQQKNRIQQ